MTTHKKEIIINLLDYGILALNSYEGNIPVTIDSSGMSYRL